MGRVGVTSLATIVLFPVMLAAALAVLHFARLWGFVPARDGGFACLLLLCLGFGLLYVGSTLDALIVTPRILQQKYLGQSVGGPLALIRFESGGFQDPYQFWHYRLTPAQRAALAPRCKWERRPGEPPDCYLFSAMDERRFASVSIEEGNLVLRDGFH